MEDLGRVNVAGEATLAVVVLITTLTNRFVPNAAIHRICRIFPRAGWRGTPIASPTAQQPSPQCPPSSHVKGNPP
jgi:hypothetical protein